MTLIYLLCLVNILCNLHGKKMMDINIILYMMDLLLQQIISMKRNLSITQVVRIVLLKIILLQVHIAYTI